jgi:glycosyltransferase involved in cell wall biosynthesis
VTRQVDALRQEHELVVAAWGPPSHADVDYVALAEAGRGRYAPVVRFGITATLRVARRFEHAYWLDRRFPLWREQLCDVRPDLVLVNDGIALPVAFEAAANAPVVFDAHEFAPTEHAELFRWRMLIQPLIRHICAAYLPRVAAMTAVSGGIARLYEQLGSPPPSIVTNAPPFVDLTPTPVERPIRLMHFGGADPLRHLDDMVELMGNLDDGFTLDLLLVGNARYIARLKKLAAGDDRIRFPAPVSMQELVHVANAADVGVFLHRGDNPQRRYTLPNKFFEFIQARLAVAIGPSPEMAKIVRGYECGIVSPTFEPQDLAALLSTTDAQQLWQFKENSDAAARVLNAEQNAPIIRKVIADALGASSRSSAQRGATARVQRRVRRG